jgi:hypothetical protein
MEKEMAKKQHVISKKKRSKQRRNDRAEPRDDTASREETAEKKQKQETTYNVERKVVRNNLSLSLSLSRDNVYRRKKSCAE